MIENIKTVGRMTRQFFRDWFLPVHTQDQPENLVQESEAEAEPLSETSPPAAPGVIAPEIRQPEGERYSR